MASWLWFLCALSLAVRVLAARRFCRVPAAYGPDRFFTLSLATDDDRRTAIALGRRYRRAILAPFALDLAIVPALVLSGREALILYEQFVALVLSAIYYRLVAVHFASRARLLAAPTAAPAQSRVQLSLETRRLRDHSRWLVEVAIAALIVPALALAVRQQLAGGHDDGPGAWRRSLFPVIWLLYVQLGLVLLKQLFIRMRLKLPVERTQEYLRWRATWLAYHLNTFDALRVMVALVLLYVALSTTAWSPSSPRSSDSAGPTWDRIATIALPPVLVLLILFLVRERRRLAAVEREVRPIELMQNLPSSPVAEGRFLAGGLLFVNRDHPGMLARSPAGIAINLGNRSTYVWAAYLLGLVVLVVQRIL